MGFNLKLFFNYLQLGYTLFFKTESETTWQVIELSPEANSFTLESLKCGTLYMIKLQAHNRVAMGSVSDILSTSTRGSGNAVGLIK